MSALVGREMDSVELHDKIPSITQFARLSSQVETSVDRNNHRMKPTPRNPSFSVSPLAATFLAVSLGCSLTSCEKAESRAIETDNISAAEKTEGDGKPMKHLIVPDVTTLADAQKIFLERTAEITGKTKLDNAEMHEIHMSTYHLEKAVAYFAENSEGARKEAAEKIAVVVEEVHLASENFKAEETKEHLAELGKLAEPFSAGFE